MSAVKPNYVRPMDLHSHTDGCDDKRADGSSYCIPVYTAADYETLVVALQEIASKSDCYFTRNKARAVIKTVKGKA